MSSSTMSFDECSPVSLASLCSIKELPQKTYLSGKLQLVYKPTNPTLTLQLVCSSKEPVSRGEYAPPSSPTTKAYVITVLLIGSINITAIAGANAGEERLGQVMLDFERIKDGCVGRQVRLGCGGMTVMSYKVDPVRGAVMIEIQGQGQQIIQPLGKKEMTILRGRSSNTNVFLSRTHKTL